MAKSDTSRTALLDTAERLFAQYGVAQVSDRRVADVAGNSNHSAVRYYFGSRDGLLHALLIRHLVGLEETRQRMFALSTSIVSDVRCLVIPVTSALAELPRPTWRARFLAQALTDPTVGSILRSMSAIAPSATLITQSVASRLDHLDDRVIAGRARLMAQMVSTACADVEARAEDQQVDADWHDLGEFLADAIAGMLQAPIGTARES